MLSSLSRRAARQRRRLLLLVIVTTLPAIALASGANLTTQSGWLSVLNASTLGHLLVLWLGFWLALRAAALCRQAVFGLANLKQAQKQVWQAAFDGSSERIILQGGVVVDEEQASGLLRAGGPARLQVHLDSAAIIESSQGELNVLGPGNQAHILASDERLQVVLDLRDQTLKLDLWARTKDGVRVRVDGARVVYSLARGSRGTTMGLPHPFDKQAAIRLYTSQRVERRAAGPGQPAAQAGLVAAEGASFFRSQLQEFISEFHLGELLTSPSQNVNSENPADLLVARDRLRETFMKQAATKAGERGLAIQWIHMGAWAIDERAQSLIGSETAKGGETSESAYQDAYSETMKQLYDDLPQTMPNSDNWLGEALAGYARLFQRLQDKFPTLVGEDEEHLSAVRRFTRVLSKSLGGSP